MDWIITGASRGIGRALALELARRAREGDRLFVLARDRERLEDLARTARGPAEVRPVLLDQAHLAHARQVGEALAGEVRGATLVHNAGVWPTRRELVDGHELGYATNCLGPLALQAPLLEAARLSRVLVVSAGLLIKGRFDAERTPSGGDFSAIRTYATTKLAGAVALREEARRWPEVDVAIVHPGVVRTELGAMRGPLGWLMRLVKLRWESPETCAVRLARLLDRPRWSARAGEAPWIFEESEQPWPAEVDHARDAVCAAVERDLSPLLRRPVGR